ncbi:synaptotagmin-2 [Tachysurus fulvidraco]|uniref:synaptotagmin-2 n=1 Tax=Tachysurus fulvidraco TaxID=1234273 RepID=UPI000F4F3E65|nr:synaptotagmin-2 [Tachysurus fulvidraco]XP_027017078.1 synaptotagmin-2 [Tachysurus fulvidraco]
MFLSATSGNSIWNIRIPFSEEAKYWALGTSVFLFLIAICIMIWQIHRYCTQLTGSRHTVNSSLLDIRSAKDETSKNSQIPKYQLYFHQDELGPLRCCLSSNSDLASSTDSLWDVDKDHIQGTLRFSLLYDQLQSRLVVTVLEARGLTTHTFSQSVDHFVHVRVLCIAVEDEEQQFTCVLQEWQTHPIKNNCNPTFGDTFSCTVTEEEMPRFTVRLEVRHFDKYSRHGILGQVRVSLKGLNILYPLEMLADLQRPKKDIVGEVLLSLKYMPTSHRLEVGVLKIRMVFRSSKSERALYARTKIVCNQCRIRHQRTSERTRWDVTVFNEVLIFNLPEAQIRECILTLSVYELCPRKRSKCLIGQLSFGKGENVEDDHWTLMMHALRQPVAKWHLLYL